jgi:hypothetical protein
MKENSNDSTYKSVVCDGGLAHFCPVAAAAYRLACPAVAVRADPLHHAPAVTHYALRLHTVIPGIDIGCDCASVQRHPAAASAVDLRR